MNRVDVTLFGKHESPGTNPENLVINYVDVVNETLYKK